MSKVLVTESSLESIADAIRAKLGVETEYKPGEMAAAIDTIATPNLDTLSVTQNGTYTPTSPKNGFSQVVANVPNTYAAGDEGKVVSSGALVAQTAHAEVTQNGTIDTTLNNSVTVNVSGGGGQTPGLPASVQANILASAYAGNFYGSDSPWGGLTISGEAKKNLDFICFFGSNNFASYDFESLNHSATIYIVCYTSVNTTYAQIINVPYSSSTYNVPAIDCHNGTINATTWGNTLLPGGYGYELFAMAMRIDNDNKKVKFYKGSTYAEDISFSNSGQIFYASKGYGSNSEANVSFGYIGIVDGVESDQTIVSNLQSLMSVFGIGE